MRGREGCRAGPCPGRIFGTSPREGDAEGKVPLQVGGQGKTSGCKEMAAAKPAQNTGVALHSRLEKIESPIPAPFCLH
ncbi:hypothetical protein GRJ2_001561900 [Grus japonensis]|uniref:Uncharacterized protein n=1 Tax=Grus japonensis TaxID=30415 RepID=A0ABC9X062_GRUJA